MHEMNYKFWYRTTICFLHRLDRFVLLLMYARSDLQKRALNESLRKEQGSPLYRFLQVFKYVEKLSLS